VPSDSVGSDWVRFRFIGADERGGDGFRCGRHSWRRLHGELRETEGGEGIAMKGEMPTIKVLNSSYWWRGEEEERRQLFVLVVGEMKGAGLHDA
jgi:hypothetical protein